jgi:hypothetical protein
MTLINVRIAAELAGKDRSTIIRAIEEGRLSAAKDQRGRYQIDPAELERVYGSLRVPDERTDAGTDEIPSSSSSDAMRTAALTREVELIRELWDRERRTWEEERTFLRSMLERATDQVKALTDQRQPRPGFWQRLLRREA